MSASQLPSDSPLTAQFRRCMGSFATGVTIVAVQHEGEYAGMTLNAFTSVSLMPLLVAVSLAHTTRTLDLVTRSQRFAVSILNSEQIEVARSFAIPGAPFPMHHVETERDRQVRVPGALAYVACDVVQQVMAGDHDIVIGRVVDFQEEEGRPLLFHGGVFGHLDSNSRAA